MQEPWRRRVGLGLTLLSCNPALQPPFCIGARYTPSSLGSGARGLLGCVAVRCAYIYIVTNFSLRGVYCETFGVALRISMCKATTASEKTSDCRSSLQKRVSRRSGKSMRAHSAVSQETFPLFFFSFFFGRETKVLTLRRLVVWLTTALTQSLAPFKVDFY